MVIHHANGLHVGVSDGGPEKFETALFHVLADGVRNGCTRRNLVGMINDRLPIRHKAVHVFIE